MKNEIALIYNIKQMTVNLYPGDFLKIIIIVVLNNTIHLIITGILCIIVTENSWEQRYFTCTEYL